MNGVVILNKPAGITSFDAVAKLRRIFHTKRIGHTGTLDPMATGVLPICVGNATAAVDLITETDKRYTARAKLGIVTDTQDTTGEILEKKPVPSLSKTQIEAVLKQFTGEIEQTPPMYSAIKIDGKKLYELAREGKEIDRPARRVTIYSLSVDELTPTEFTLFVHCSKGVYVRTLIHDIGQVLGCGAAMASLERTAVGEFTLEKAVLLQTLCEAEQNGNLSEYLIPTDHLFSQPRLFLNEKQERLVKNGVPIYYQGTPNTVFRVYGANHHFLCLSKLTVIDGRLCLKSIKNFFNKEI